MVYLLKKFQLIFLAVIVCLLSGCNWFNSEEKKVAAIEEPRLIILNVNDEDSFNDSHILGSLNFPYEKVVSDADYLKNKTSAWNKTSQIIVYCIDYACTASHEVAKLLDTLGFNNVKVYNGGIQEWYQLAQSNKKDYPYVGVSLKPYLKRPILKIESNDARVSGIIASDLSKLMHSANKV